MFQTTAVLLLLILK